MSAFRPISPRAAVQILEDADVGVDAALLLVDLAAAGVVKGYARLIESGASASAAVEVRNKRIDRVIWKEVVSEQVADQVYAVGSVRLSASGTSVIGIRFDEKSVRAAAARHGEIPEEPAASIKVVQIKPASLPPEPVSKPVEAIAPKEVASARPAPILDASRVSLSVAEAAGVLGLSRGTIYKLLDDGQLGSVKIGGRRLVNADSVRELIA